MFRDVYSPTDRADVFIERTSSSVFHPKFHLYRRVDVSSRKRPLSRASFRTQYAFVSGEMREI